MMQEHRQQSMSGGQLNPNAHFEEFFKFESWHINVISERIEIKDYNQ